MVTITPGAYHFCSAPIGNNQAFARFNMKNDSNSDSFFGFFAELGPRGRILFSLGLLIIFWRGPEIFLGLSGEVPDDVTGELAVFGLIGYAIFLLIGLPSLIKLIVAIVHDRSRDPADWFVCAMGAIVLIGFPLSYYASHLAG
jgi:hypothetical protein